jgi:hypothetical protein
MYKFKKEKIIKKNKILLQVIANRNQIMNLLNNHNKVFNI